MSGHSKWANIKRKKEATDSARAKIFTKIGREMSVVVKEGGPDPNNNAKLRDLIAKAKANNVPNDNIERIIKKAAGDGDKNNYETMIYEGYGPCGVAVIVECLTDNKNRTAGDVRHYFDKFGGNLGTSGCVSFMFSDQGTVIIDKLIDLEPENITVHTLSIKRAARLNQVENDAVFNNPASQMVEYATKRLLENGYQPYYLYRQKNMLDNLENIGWCKPEKESLYNIYIMEEVQTILAVGAGGSTKLVDLKKDRLERVFNYKFPLEYNKHFDLMLKKKDETEVFYAE